MNKKFSTLLTTALFFSGALFSEAYAEKLSDYLNSPATKVENGTKYILVQKNTDFGGVALGIKSYNVDTKVVEYDGWGANITRDDFEQYLEDYAWTVTETKDALSGKTFVTFKNAKYNLELNVANDGLTLVTNYATAKSDTYSNLWAWDGDFASYENAYNLYKNTGVKLFAGKHAYDVATTSNGTYTVLDWGCNSAWATVSVADTNDGIILYQIKDQEVSDDELNKLYNSAGFNFKIKDGVDNIFADQRIKAIKVDEPLYSSASSEDFGFPAGTYFVTETPKGQAPKNNPAELYDYLLNSTFIALSASENVSTNAKLQASGEGFVLTTVKGKDLNLFIADKQSIINETPAEKQTSGSTISVLNAAFTVKTNIINNKDKYALLLNRVRIQEKAADPKHVYKTVVLDIKSDKSYESKEALVSTPGTDPSFIFEFVESSVVEGKEFLNENGAAIYNIQFVSENEDLDGLYLTNTYDNGSVKNYAKGIAIADPDAPAFQYVITEVKGNDVTFTNRETGKSFTAQLFKEEGDNTYSLALTTDPHFYLTSINNKGDIDVETKASDLHLAWVKLTPATVNKFAGFLDVEDEAKMTLTFARDLDPTSNKLYPVVLNNKLQSKMTDKVEEAAQWQLIKSEEPSYATHDYVYLDADKKVATKTLGDTVAYYTYKFQYVYDGLAKDYFLNDHLALENTAAKNAASYVVKENANGSVDILKDYNTKEYLVVSAYADGKLNNLNRSLAFVNVHQYIQATEIKTYLVQDAPEISLPADASYVTLKSEKGNYIAMDGDRDGIVVNSDPITFRVLATDLKNVVPSFYVTTGWNEEDHSRMFLFNPEDSVNYYVGEGKYDKEYQWDEETTKAIFKSGSLNASLDTLTTTIKGNKVKVAMKADNAGVQGGLDYFKYQIILANADDADDLYIIRTLADAEERYLCNINDKLTWTSNRKMALKFYVEDVDAPTANESINAANNVVVAGVNGAVVVKGAEGKNVIVSTILGKVVANEVVSSDNATIAAPAGVVVVSVDGESFKVVVK